MSFEIILGKNYEICDTHIDIYAHGIIFKYYSKKLYDTLSWVNTIKIRL
jgi:hypothetical protein